MRLFLFFSLFIIFCLASCKEKTIDTPDGPVTPKNGITASIPVFEKVKSDSSQLYFSNDITENVETLENLFNFDYFYNGAGVGVEDLNNDGLLEVFFCGNQVDNKLFLNEGQLKFKDISATAGINSGKKWSNGITFVDINNDGLKDIYVSQGGPNTRYDRKNLLFINKGDLSFEEQAEAYGLADMGISTQSAFFDYDGDGDLDCLVMNENELYGLDPISLYRTVGNDPEKRYFNSSHLYRNDKGSFVDVTKSAGLERPIFGLGLCISDINNDGWLDIYIASDYYIPDALFTNNGNGTFTDSVKDFTNHTSFYGMGLDIADIDNDGLQDIFVLDMSSSDHVRSKTLMASMSNSRFDYLVNKANFQYQYMYNTLQLNLGNNKFNDIAQLTETANTDWSWSVLMSDYDNDEDADIFITNGYRRYALDNDLQIKVFETKKRYGNNLPLAIKKQLYNDMPSEKLPNILFQNSLGLEFNEKASEWGLADFSFSNGAAQGDLDNDGDLDLVVNNMDENAFLYRNTTVDNALGNYLKVTTKGENSDPFAKIRISYGGKSQTKEGKRVRGYMSAQDPAIHFGLGRAQVLDTVTVIWPDGKVENKYGVKANSNIAFEHRNAMAPGTKNEAPRKTPFQNIDASQLGLDFVHVENYYDDFETEVLLPYKQSNMGPFISKGDLNGDGREDLYIGGASGQAGQLFLQGDKGYTKLKSAQLEADRQYEDMESVFFDFDNDKDLDLYVVSGGNEFGTNSSYYADRIYLNDGKGNLSRYESKVLSAFPKNGKSVSIIDFDHDGDSDILVGNRVIPQSYPKFSPSTLYENLGGALKEVTQEKAPALASFGIVNSIITTDFDNDGWDDFIAVGEWTGIGFFKNNKGTFSLLPADSAWNDKGWWFSIHETDINNDGLKDYLVGNVGLNLKFKASSKKPFKIFANDFDDNGVNDVVLSKEYHGEYVPVRGRECTSQQMPFIKEKFGTYSEFANATMTDIYGEKLSQSYEGEVTEFRSVLLLNKGKGQFEKVALPIYAQQFPLLSIAFVDFDKDGFEDCILAGNLYEMEVETPRLDAISGLVLRSNGKDGYEALPYVKTGLYVNGNAKNITWVAMNGQNYLLDVSNNNRLNAYKYLPN